MIAFTKEIPNQILQRNFRKFLLTQFRMGGKASKPLWLLFSTLLAYFCKIFKAYLVLVWNYCTRTKSTPQKNCFFWSNSYEVEVTITSPTEMLELPNTLVTWPYLQYNLRHGINFCWWHHGQKLWRHNLYFKTPLF